MQQRKKPALPGELILRAPAKINWTLAVLGRRADGYHEIDSVFQTISLFDELRIRRASRPECLIACDDSAIPTDETNLIHRAWNAMRQVMSDRVGGIKVTLTKRIPSGAGLGGGSSDAAATLIALNRLYGLRLRKPALAEIAAGIGSDVPFFIHGGAARCRGRGEILQPIESKLQPVHLVVVFPGFQSATREAYARLKPSDFGGGEHSAKAVAAMKRGSAAGLTRELFNVFDSVLTKTDPRYEALKAAMREAGLDTPMLSGSGSACFGFAKDRRSALKARDQLKQTYNQTFAVHSIHSGISRVTLER